MATKAQFKANIRNAQKSKGPTSPQGKAASSRNHLITCLYTMNDFVLPEEIDTYKYFCGRFEDSCNAGDAIEECLTSEITSAAWRLRRCNIADGDVAEHSVLEPLLDTTLEKQQKLDGIMNEPAPDWNEIDRQIAENKAKTAESASNCKTPEHAATAASPEAPEAPSPARGRPCPCKSGKKYKHCCGKNTPWKSKGTA